ncbi:MAG: NAD-binding protein, partial [bacterium]
MFGASSRFKHVGRAVMLLLVVLAIGAYGFMVLEGYPFLDAVYMTVITISTVGFQEVRALSGRGHVFVIILIIIGLSVMTYTLSAIAQIIIEGQFRKLLGRRLMQREINSLKQHYIICGHGRMGKILCEELRQEAVPFVVVEGDTAEGENLREQGYLVVEGDATEDEVLDQA